MGDANKVMKEVATGERWFVTGTVRDAAAAYVEAVRTMESTIIRLSGEGSGLRRELREKAEEYWKQVSLQAEAIAALRKRLAEEIEKRQVAEAQLEDSQQVANRLLAELNDVKAEWNQMDDSQHGLKVRLSDATDRLTQIKNIIEG